jgi:hypothetical protein
VFGNSVNPALFSEVILPFEDGNMKFWERLTNIILYVTTRLFLKPFFYIRGVIQVRTKTFEDSNKMPFKKDIREIETENLMK